MPPLRIHHTQATSHSSSPRDPFTAGFETDCVASKATKAIQQLDGINTEDLAAHCTSYSDPLSTNARLADECLDNCPLSDSRAVA